MLRWRLIFGFLLIALMIALCWADVRSDRPGIYLVPLAMIACVLATKEMLGLARYVGCQPLPWATYIGTFLPVLGASMPVAWKEYPTDCAIGKLGWLACGLAAGLLLIILGEMRRYEKPGQVVRNLAPAVLSVSYVGGLLGFLIQLRLLHDSMWGMVALLSLIGTVKLSDTCQYLFGNLFGRHKLISKLSPGKTWEGAVEGIASAVVVASLVLWFWMGKTEPPQFYLGVLLYCLLIAVAGIYGDLAVSMLKRDAGVKDSSSWLPGFGGVLDLLDSLLFAAPVAYFCWAAGLLGP